MARNETYSSDCFKLTVAELDVERGIGSHRGLPALQAAQFPGGVSLMSA